MDSSQGWNRTVIALPEQMASSGPPGALGGHQMTPSITDDGHPCGENTALMARHGTRRCVQDIANSPLPGGGT